MCAKVREHYVGIDTFLTTCGSQETKVQVARLVSKCFYLLNYLVRTKYKNFYKLLLTLKYLRSTTSLTLEYTQQDNSVIYVHLRCTKILQGSDIGDKLHRSLWS